MNWLILIIAGLFEVGFALCLGKARETTGAASWFWLAGFLLSLPLMEITGCEKDKKEYSAYMGVYRGVFPMQQRFPRTEFLCYS